MYGLFSVAVRVPCMAACAEPWTRAPSLMDCSQVAAADADVDRSNAARQSEGQRMLEAIKGRAADYAAQQVLHACVSLWPRVSLTVLRLVPRPAHHVLLVASRNY